MISRKACLQQHGRLLKPGEEDGENLENAKANAAADHSDVPMK